MSQTLSATEWYRYSPVPVLPPPIRSFVPEPEEGVRALSAGPIHLINVSSPPVEVIDPAVPEYVLSLLLNTPPILRVGFNRRPRWLAVSAGSMMLLPPNTEAEFVVEDKSHVLVLAIPQAIAEDYAQDAGVRLDLRREEAFREPRLMQQIVQLWHELADEEPGNTLYADHVMRSVLHTLTRRAGEDLRRARRRRREQLPNHTIRRLRDYVEHRLSDDLDVMALAGVAELSPAHFARAFAETLGVTPFRYVMMRRLERARELLERTHRSTLDIALDVGFKTPSHFTSRFRQEFGLTPRAIRPDARRSQLQVHLGSILEAPASDCALATSLT
jgi:AraC family transcriptional regulator